MGIVPSGKHPRRACVLCCSLAGRRSAPSAGSSDRINTYRTPADIARMEAAKVEAKYLQEHLSLSNQCRIELQLRAAQNRASGYEF